MSATHRAQLHAAIEQTRRPTGATRPRRQLVAAALVAALIGSAAVVSALDDGAPHQVVASDGEPSADGGAPAPSTNTSVDPLVSAACGGLPLPFVVPVGDGYGDRVDGPAPGAPDPTVAGQLAAHWRTGSTSIEVRWPADLSAQVADELGVTHDDVQERVAQGVSPASYVGADLTIDRTVEPDGSIHAAATAFRTAASWRANPPPGGIYRMAVVGYEQPAPSEPRDSPPVAAWGQGLCAAVQVTVLPMDGDGEVLDEAARLHDDLVAAGGPLQPATESEPLVAARIEADSLEPVTECDVPPGVTQAPTKSERFAASDVHATPDEALAAHLETRIMTDEGPFGPVEWSTVATAGYTAISLLDGSVAYEFPDPPAPLPELVGYLIAERVDGGWSITRGEGPSC